MKNYFTEMSEAVPGFPDAPTTWSFTRSTQGKKTQLPLAKIVRSTAQYALRLSSSWEF